MSVVSANRPTACGWCGRLVYDWQRQGQFHYDGVCVGNVAGQTDATLNAYHSATTKTRRASEAAAARRVAALTNSALVQTADEMRERGQR